MVDSEFTPGGNEIAAEIWPILFWSKLLGNCPIVTPEVTNIKSPAEIHTAEGNENCQYRFYPKISLTAALNAVLISCFTLFSALFIINVVFQHPFLIHSMVNYGEFPKFAEPRNGTLSSFYSETQIVFMKTVISLLVHGFHQIYQIVQIVFAWACVVELAEFLNSWTYYSSEFNNLFGHLSMSVEKCVLPGIRIFRRRLLLYYVAIPTFLLTPMFVFIGFTVQGWGGLCILSIAIQLVPRALLEDSKCLITYKALQQTFAGIRQGIELTTKTNIALQPSTVKAWKNLIEFTRLQCQRAGKMQSSLQLLVLCLTVLTITVFVFSLFVQKALDPVQQNTMFLILCVGFSAKLVGRLYFKIVLAETITAEEQNICNALSKLNMGFETSDILLYLQVQQILILLQQSPISISYSGYAVLKKSLLLGLHVLTLRYNYSLKFVSSKESNSSSYSDSQIKLVSIAAKVLSSGFLQSFQIYEIWFAWTTAGELVNFLNCWAFFAKQFDQCFREINITVQSAFIPNLRKVRRKLFIFLGVIPVFTLLPFYLIVNQASQRLTYISLVSVGLQLIPRRFLEEGKIYMMFAILQESYAQIGYGITTWAQRGAKIDAAVVQFWKRLIIFIRAQCNLVSKIHSGLELVLSFYSMVGVTVLVFILINYTALESNGRNLGFLSLSACFTIALLLRLYAKCSMAEEITVQEQKVSNLLCNLSAERDSCDVPLQLQFQQIYSLLQQSPITINMGSYGTLNKRLVLTVFGQVVTYLIVLLQLNSSMRNIEN
ncbi:unnamed protein product [Allacma fusca]|uniref:Gustatory receptor n=1 Tax=Allacma fusca TaxID=39272 RepID=A0A8J2M5B9_9HEXA|nr:unnamed protein product [Allacma fusca]